MRIATSFISLLSCLTAPLTANIFYVSPEEPIAPQFNIQDIEKNSTTFSCGIVRTQGSIAYNETGTQVPFFEQYGTTPIKNIYQGLTPKSGTLSERYFADDGAEPVTEANATLRFNDRFNYYLLQSYHAAITHYLFSGIFCRIYVHFTDQIIAQKASASGRDDEHPAVSSLISHFDQFLGENNHPAISYNKRQLNLEHAGFFIGWNGKAILADNLIQEIKGSVLAGYTFAPTHFDHPLAPAFLPHPAAHSYSAQAALTAQINNHLAADFSFGTSVFGRLIDTMHVVRDDNEPATVYANTPLLGLGKVRKDPGTLWVAEGSLVANRFWGFYAAGGYHFAYQEKTQLTLHDDTILQGADWVGTPLNSMPGKQNERLNSDVRLGNWKHHAVFVKIGYTPSSNHRFIPDINFAVYWPVMGHRATSPTRVYAGSGQLSIRWTF